MGAVCCSEGHRELSALVGLPTAAVYPPGQCVFNEDWSSARLSERVQVTHDVILVSFQLRDSSKPLGLSTCACLLAKFDDTNGEPVVRPYTPVSTNALPGTFRLCIKVYDKGKMSQHLDTLPIGSSVDFKHIPVNVKIQYPFKRKHVTMLVGGTGITPMIQALHAILGTEGDTTKVSIIFGNKTEDDILCRELLDKWSRASAGRLRVIHVLSESASDGTWQGLTGFITRDIIEKNSAAGSDDTLVMVCGPPPMYKALCGPRDEKEVTGILKDMGFSEEQVFKF